MTSSVVSGPAGSADDRSVLVRVAIPHFYRPGDKNTGYGSTRSDAQLRRIMALSRCLGGVLALTRGPGEEVLGIAQQQLLAAPPPAYPSRLLQGVEIDCHLFVNCADWLQPVVAAVGSALTVHQLELDDPKRLPYAARDFLLEDGGDGVADLSLYLEDDLVIQDRLYVDKLIWFTARTEHRFALMPHRFEPTGDPAHPRLFVDGPIAATSFPAHHQPAAGVASGQFWDGQMIQFDVASNPHSGSFALSAIQRQLLAKRGVADDGFVGPLETVATYTVLQHLPVLKPSWPCRDFLTLEHGHPSFLYWRDKLPRSTADGTGSHEF